eukprot:GILI01046607.1.p1 GENE.GILI01046607.1~~GILI01046607.1.p1  ORF type:complete len:216 (-),score=43.82 GILI01046607.1:38-685(-)
MAELVHLSTPWDVDRFIVTEENKLVLVRFSKYESRLPASWRLKRKRNREAIAKAEKEAVLGLDSARIDDMSDDDAAAPQVASSSDDTLQAFGLNEDEIKIREEHVRRCSQIDAVLVSVAPQVRKFCVVYAVDTEEVPEFDKLYELDDPDETFGIMFFYRNRHLKLDLSTGNNNKINFLVGASELIQIIDVAYKAGKEGKTTVNSELRFGNAGVKQ